MTSATAVIHIVDDDAGLSDGNWPFAEAAPYEAPHAERIHETRHQKTAELYEGRAV
jgi:hypothetical protein